MCGIVAVISAGEFKPQQLLEMVQALRHRGPNACGTWISGDRKVALGHARLSIIDLSNSGAQPMHSQGPHKAHIAFNGEIYNFRELKKELAALGHHFASNSDTEVLLTGYLQWGEGITAKLNGMWSFIIFDESKNKVFISRDRVGMKPLYIMKRDGNIVLASEVKAILRSGLVEADLDNDGLVEYFTFQNIISNKTLFKDIEYFPAGYNAIYDLDNATYREYQYWDFDFKYDINNSMAELANELHHIFVAAVDRHLIADVDVGVTLSGGMDSSSITAIASSRVERLNTFTGFFDTSSVDIDDRCHSEYQDARVIAELFGSHHHERLITPSDVIASMPAIIWHLEDPKVAMCYTFYAIAQMVSQRVTVNLSGTGGDELFGGYPWRYSLVDGLSSVPDFKRVYYNYWCRLANDQSRASFFTDKVMRDGLNMNRPFEEFCKIVDRKSEHSILNQALYFELKTFLVGMLMVEDKMGMAFSIETRFPFLDKEVMDFAQSVPSHLKYHNNEAKLLLKQAMSGILPTSAIHKKKQGFTPPDKSWYKNELSYYINNLLLSKKSMIGEYISRERIREVLNRHMEGMADERMMIWSFIYFEGWLRTFIANSGKSLILF